jgi:hypothetical protein
VTAPGVFWANVSAVKPTARKSGVRDLMPNRKNIVMFMFGR